MEIAQHQPSVLALAFQPLRDMFVFGGRSTRSEVVGFFVLGVLANMMTITIDGPGALLLDAAKVAWGCLWGFPWIALFVRRLHDQDRSGQWGVTYLVLTYLALPLLALLLVGVPQSADIHSSHLGALSWHYPTMTPLTVMLLAVAFGASVLQPILFLLPGTPGANRFGPDPREGEPV